MLDRHAPAQLPEGVGPGGKPPFQNPVHRQHPDMPLVHFGGLKGSGQPRPHQPVGQRRGDGQRVIHRDGFHRPRPGIGPENLATLGQKHRVRHPVSQDDQHLGLPCPKVGQVGLGQVRPLPQKRIPVIGREPEMGQIMGFEPRLGAPDTVLTGAEDRVDPPLAQHQHTLVFHHGDPGQPGAPFDQSDQCIDHGSSPSFVVLSSSQDAISFWFQYVGPEWPQV